MSRAVPQRSPSSPHRASLAFFAALPCIALFLGPASISASQASPRDSSTTVPTTHPAPTFHQARHHLHPIPKQPQTPADAAPAPQVVAAPEMPHWPANDKPETARIVWDSHGLRIEAANSSLAEILSEVSTLTGAHVDGFATDARVYGQYGPAPARDVLSQLLDGTGYNVMMIGDIGAGAPRQIILSTRSAASAIPAAHTTTANDDDADVDEPVQPQPFPLQQPLRAPFNPATIRNPQQFPPGQQPYPGQQPNPGQQPQQPNQQ